MSEHTFGIATKALIIKDDELLIIYKSEKEAKEWSSASRRDLPGGRLEFGEEPKVALAREIAEETGLTVDVLKPLDVWHLIKDRFQLVGINYLCRWKFGEVVLSAEHDAYEWVSESELRTKNWRDLERYLQAFDSQA